MKFKIEVQETRQVLAIVTYEVEVETKEELVKLMKDSQKFQEVAEEAYIEFDSYSEVIEQDLKTASIY